MLTLHDTYFKNVFVMCIPFTIPGHELNIVELVVKITILDTFKTTIIDDMVATHNEVECVVKHTVICFMM